jgi:inorganic pyrophosphatase
MVVETPRGSVLKLAYDPEERVFAVSRALALGISYPFDWGFIPQTRAADGDPVDALALHEGTTFPGVVLQCRPLGIVDVEQDREGGKVTNPRLILVPAWEERLANLSASALPVRVRQELEQFFVSATFFTSKNPKIKGWRNADAAEAFVRAKLIS